MKKITTQMLPLVAALLAAPAFAQMKAPTLTWNFSGEFDVGFRSIKHDDPTQSRTFLNGSNTYTTLLIGRLTADFGNDLKGIAMAEIDHDPTNSNKSNQAVGGNVFLGSPFQGQQYVGLESSRFGAIKLGIPNSWGLPTSSIATPFGTGQGGGYYAGDDFKRLGSTPVSGVTNHVGNGSGRIVRHERTVVYESPVFAGFSGDFEFSPGNDNAADASANNNNQWLGLGIKFQRPNFVVMGWHGQAKAGDARAAGSTPPSSTTQVANALAAGQSVKWDMIGGNFRVSPNVTVYGGWTKTKTSNDVENSHSWNVAGKYTMGDIDFMANYLVRSANTGVNAPAANKVPKGRLIGLGVDYRFDATGLNAVYWRYENVDKNDALGRTFRSNSVGVRVGFNI